MTVLAITDKLQDLELDSQSSFASDPFQEAKSFVTEKLDKIADFSPDLGDITSQFDDVATALPNSGGLPVPPLGAAELKSQVEGRLKSLSNLNLETLTKSLPTTPGLDTFKDLDITAKVNEAVTSLGSAITGNDNFGDLNVGTDDSPILAEFDDFIRNAKAFPARLLDALLTTFKTLLDKIAHPEEWLDALSSEALTEIFQEQIQSVAASLPTVAVRQGAEAITLRGEQASKLSTLLNKFTADSTTFDSLSHDTITSMRQQIKGMKVQIEQGDRTLVQTLANLTDFDLTQFNALLATLPDSGSGQIKAIADLFTKAETFVDSLNGRMSEVTKLLKSLIQQVKTFIEQVIEKVSEVAGTVVGTIETQLTKATSALTQVRDYIQKAIQTIRDFVDKATEQVEAMVKPVKKAFNQVSTTATGGIESLSKSIQTQITSLDNAIKEVSGTLDQHLNKAEMENKIRAVLGKVTGLLEGPAVQSAIATAEEGIDQVVVALNQVSLEPAFQGAVSKTKGLEADLKAIDTATLGTAQKTALKVGVKLLQQVDVPGVVTPELTAAFDEVLNPVVNITELVQAEIHQVTGQVHSFEPGTLVQNVLQPYIDTFVTEIEEYRPSKLLQPVKDIYNTLLEKLELLNPAQLLSLLDDLYQELLNVLEALSPKGLASFLNAQLEKIATTLENLRTQDLVQRVIDSIGSVEKLVGGLGLDEVLNSKFWQTLTDILSVNLQEQIEQVDAIKADIENRINRIDKATLEGEIAVLQKSVTAFIQDPSADYEQSEIALDEAWTQHQNAIATLKADWESAHPHLEAFKPKPEFDYDYRDLVERLGDLYNLLILETELTDQHDQIKEFVAKATGKRTAEAKRLKPTKAQLKKTAAALRDRTDDEIITAFQKVIPTELEQQFFAPVQRILKKLDITLAQPREVLGNVEGVIIQLANAPSEIASILKDLALDLGDQIKRAISAVVSTIRSFNFDFLNDLHRQIVDQIAALRPSYLVNAFHDLSDFAGSSMAALLARLRQATPDPVSQYLLAQLTETQRTLLHIDGEATHTLVIKTLNLALDDPKLYSPERFGTTELSAEAIKLRDRRTRFDSQDRVRFNRLLLESFYTKEVIVLSLESIFPFFMEKLKALYPDRLVASVDTVYETIVQAVKALPEVLSNALNAEYKALLAIFKRVIEDPIDRIFAALILRLRGLQSELGIGLEDVSDAYRQLLVAVPV